MAAEKIPSYITPEEYLLQEDAAETKSEYHNGVVIAMAGADTDHNRIVFDTGFACALQVRPRGCEVLTSEQRVSVPRCNKYFYPDVVVICEDVQLESIKGVRSLQNPMLIIDVLSDSTERADRSGKFVCYQTLPSLQTYMLISQYQPHAETFTRQTDVTWEYAEFDGLETTVPLPAIGCELRLADVYARIAFPAAERAEDQGTGEQG